MARIPSLNGQQTRLSPLPGGRSSGGAPLSTFGGGEQGAAGYEATADLGSSVGKMASRDFKHQQEVQEDARAKMLSVASREYASKLTAQEINLKTQLQKARGKEALEASTAALAAFDEYHEGEMKGVQDNDLKQLFNAHYGQYRNSLRAYAEPYANGQLREWNAQTIDSLVDNEKRAAKQAWMDEKRVGLSLDRILFSLHDYAKENGEPPEWVASTYGKTAEDVHQTVISKMLAANRLGDAKNYLANHRKEVGDADTLDRAVAQQDELASVQKAVDDVMKGDQDTLGVVGVKPVLRSESLNEGLERIDKMAEKRNPKWREEARGLLKQRWADMEHAEKMEQENIFEGIADAYEAEPTRDVRKIDPVGYAKLKQKYKAALGKLGVNDEKNDGLFLDFMGGKTLDELAEITPAEFMSEVWSKLPSKGDQREKARTRWTQARDAKEKPEKRVAFNGLLSDEQMIFKAAQDFGIGGVTKEDTLEKIREGKTGSDDKKKLALLEWRESLHTAMEAYHAIYNKNPDDKAKKELIYGLVETKYVTGATTSGYGIPANPDAARTSRVRSGEEYASSLGVPYESIAPADRSTIESYIKSKGGLVTQEKVSRMYVAYKRGDKKLIDAILSE